jgi:hypothetical protein
VDKSEVDDFADRLAGRWLGRLSQAMAKEQWDRTGERRGAGHPVRRKETRHATPQGTSPQETPHEARAARLAAALKSNLARRKNQAQARAAYDRENVGEAENRVRPDLPVTSDVAVAPDLAVTNALAKAEPPTAVTSAIIAQPVAAHETAGIAIDKAAGKGSAR